MNWIKEYVKQIEDGTIIACKKVIKEYKKLINDMDDESSRFYFNEKKANRAITFIEEFCRQSEGELGAPIKLGLWQKAFISAVFGFIEKETGFRRFREVLLLVARKNGKTTLLSAIALYMMIADREGSAECYSVATKKDQASKAFKSACDMREHSPEIREMVKKRRTDLYMPSTLSQFQPLASDSNTLDGLNSHLVIIDELHAITDRKLYEVMKQSMGSRRQPLLVMITTAGTTRECIFDDIYDYANNVLNDSLPSGEKDESFLPIMYELDDRSEWINPKVWVKANPSLGEVKTFKYMYEMVERAKNDQSSLNGILCKDFNIRENVSGSWINFNEINNLENYNLEEFNGTYAIGGCDLSSTTDLTCATLIWKRDEKIYVRQMYFIAEDVAEQREREDKVPYALWRDKGYVKFTEGNKVNYSEVTNWFVEMRDKYGLYPLWIGYDSWGSTYWKKEMENNGFIMETVIQGAKTMSNPMKILASEIKSKNVNYDNNPILKWCLTNTTLKVDENDNIRPLKGKSSKMRIDGAVSLIDAYVIYQNHFEDYNNMVRR
jgi:phage terminase large subunit-like protein